MVFCRVIFDHRKPRKRPPTYASVCTAHPGVGCWKHAPRWMLGWCSSCRYLARSRAGTKGARDAR